MFIPVNNLSEDDYRIFKYINEFSPVSETQVKEHFKDEIAIIDYRLLVLSKRKTTPLAPGIHMTQPNENYLIERGGNLYLSSLGRFVLQDYLRKEQKIERQRRNEKIYNLVELVISAMTLIFSILAVILK